MGKVVSMKPRAARKTRTKPQPPEETRKQITLDALVKRINRKLWSECQNREEQGGPDDYRQILMNPRSGYLYDAYEWLLLKFEDSTFEVFGSDQLPDYARKLGVLHKNEVVAGLEAA